MPPHERFFAFPDKWTLCHLLLTEEGHCRSHAELERAPHRPTDQLPSSSTWRKLLLQGATALLAGAVQDLFTQETKSSFACEGEASSKDCTESFVSARMRTALFEPTDRSSVQRQNGIVNGPHADDCTNFKASLVILMVIPCTGLSVLLSAKRLFRWQFMSEIQGPTRVQN